MTLFYPYVVIAPMNITLGKISGPLKMADDISYKRKRVSVFDCKLIQLAIVLDKTTDVVIAPTNITLGEILGPLKTADDISYKRERVSVFDCELI